jgi:hypothetical protein
MDSTLDDFKVDFGQLKAKVEETKRSLERRGQTIKPKNPTNRYIVLPGWRKNDRRTYFHAWGIHFVKDATGTLQAIAPCANAIFGHSCKVCDAINQAKRYVSPSDEASLKALKESESKRDYIMNVIALDEGKDKLKEVQILQVGRTIFEGLTDLIENWGEQIFNPEKAMVIQINRNGSGLNTKYTVMNTPQSAPIPLAMLVAMHDLDKFVATISDEDIAKAISAINGIAGIGFGGAAAAVLGMAAPLSAPAIGHTPVDPGLAGMLAGMGAAPAPAAQPVAAVQEPALTDSLDELFKDLN